MVEFQYCFARHKRRITFLLLITWFLLSTIGLNISFSKMSVTAATADVTKVALRSQIRKILNKMNLLERQNQSTKIQQAVIRHSAFRKAKRIGLYLSLPNEVDTSLIMDAVFNSNKLCFIPKYLSGSRDMSLVLLESLQDYHQLPTTNWNIKQPANDDQREDSTAHGGLDLMIVPAMAFTKEGLRLGKGGGYYDQFLNNLKSSSQLQFPYLIGIAFREQIQLDLPVNDHDFKMNEVITDENV